MNLVDTHLRLFGLLALLLPLYGAVQLALLAVPITRVEVRVEPFEVQVPVEVPVERIVYVPVPAAAGGASGDDGEAQSESDADEPPSASPPVLFPASEVGVAAPTSDGAAVQEDASVEPEESDDAKDGVSLAAAPLRETSSYEAGTLASAPARRPTPPIVLDEIADSTEPAGLPSVPQRPSSRGSSVGELSTLDIGRELLNLREPIPGQGLDDITDGDDARELVAIEDR